MWVEGNIVTSATPYSGISYCADCGCCINGANYNETISTDIDASGEPKEKPKKDTAAVVREYVQRHRALFGEVTVESKAKEKIA